MGRFSNKSSKTGALTGLQKKKDNNNTNINTNANDNINENINKDINKPVLEIEKKTNTRKLAGFYLDEKQIKSIDKLVKETGKDKSFIVRMAIDYFVENVEIK